MARIELSVRVAGDFERIIDHLVNHEVTNPSERIAQILAAIEVLTHSPFIGRPIADGHRELVIGRGSNGYVARYASFPIEDVVRVFAIRNEREIGSRGG